MSAEIMDLHQCDLRDDVDDIINALDFIKISEGAQFLVI
jgi:peroxiredoxin family protein